MAEHPRRQGAVRRHARAGDRSKAARGSVGDPPLPGSLTVAVSRGGCPSIDAADTHRAILGHGIQWLMFALDAEVPRRPFARGGYQTMAIDSAGVWVQKRLGGPEKPPTCEATHQLTRVAGIPG